MGKVSIPSRDVIFVDLFMFVLAIAVREAAEHFALVNQPNQFPRKRPFSNESPEALNVKAQQSRVKTCQTYAKKKFF